MKFLTMLFFVLFVQNTYALNSGTYEGTVERLSHGTSEPTGLNLIAFIEGDWNNPLRVQSISFYNAENLLTARPSRYLLVPEDISNFEFGRLALANKGSLDALKPIRYQEETAKLANIQIYFADGSSVNLRPIDFKRTHP